MIYEVCLEYGSFPVKERNGFFYERQAVPEFLKDNTALVEKLTKMNDLFHELFLTIECKFDYIGGQFPDKIEEIHALYEETTQEIREKYSDGVVIYFEEFLL